MTNNSTCTISIDEYGRQDPHVQKRPRGKTTVGFFFFFYTILEENFFFFFFT